MEGTITLQQSLTDEDPQVERATFTAPRGPRVLELEKVWSNHLCLTGLINAETK